MDHKTKMTGQTRSKPAGQPTGTKVKNGKWVYLVIIGMIIGGIGLFLSLLTLIFAMPAVMGYPTIAIFFLAAHLFGKWLGRTKNSNKKDSNIGR